MALVGHAVSLVLLFTLAVFVQGNLASYREDRQRLSEERRNALMLAYDHMDRFESTLLKQTRERGVNSESFVEALVGSPASIQAIVAGAYSTFEGAFGRSGGGGLDDRIDFEVTFMTRSYRDKGITIPAAANREGRAPPSMLDREGKVTLYDNTVTATVYREASKTAHIVEDTGTEPYAEIYPGQKARIRSSIVFPVFSDTNALLGTLVVHCNKAGFFKRAEQAYWREMLEVFCKRIAVVKARMDRIAELRQQQGLSEMKIAFPDPWF